MSFLPENYELPKSESRYYDLGEGENRFRILSEAVTGWLYWVDEQGNVLSQPVKGCQPIYVRDLGEIPKSAQANPNLSVRHFWCFVVFNRKTEQIQVCKLTQSSIMRGIEGYLRHPDWGDPIAYDFVVTKQGDGLSTKYTVMVGPKQPLDEGIMAFYRELKIDLTRLFNGEDLFRDEPEQVQPRPQANGPVHPPVWTNGAQVTHQSLGE